MLLCQLVARFTILSFTYSVVYSSNWYFDPLLHVFLVFLILQLTLDLTDNANRSLFVS